MIDTGSSGAAPQRSGTFPNTRAGEAPAPNNCSACERPPVVTPPLIAASASSGLSRHTPWPAPSNTTRRDSGIAFASSSRVPWCSWVEWLRQPGSDQIPVEDPRSELAVAASCLASVMWIVAPEVGARLNDHFASEVTPPADEELWQRESSARRSSSTGVQLVRSCTRAR